MQHSLLIWTGLNKQATVIGFSRLNHSTLLDGNPPDLAFIQDINLKLSKLFPNKQVFFMTDITNRNDVNFWRELFEQLSIHIKSGQFCSVR
uniref:Uncharacterized protein n=1 Tax=Acrobeloides nanus TaxID=290746 RepID=A0A914ECL0_9BILA